MNMGAHRTFHLTKKCLELLSRALGHQLNAPVGQILYVPRDVIVAGQTPLGVPETDTLHSACVPNFSTLHDSIQPAVWSEPTLDATHWFRSNISSLAPAPSPPRIPWHLPPLRLIIGSPSLAHSGYRHSADPTKAQLQNSRFGLPWQGRSNKGAN
jgi:hypothetical protein